MPRLPSPDDFSRAIPQSGRSMVSYQAGTPEALEAELYQQSADAAFKFVAEQDEAKAKQADLIFNEQVSQLLYDPEKGYFAQKGQNAVDGYPKIKQQIETLAQKIGGNLKNDRQQQAFWSSVSETRKALLKDAGRYAMRERQSWLKETGDARLNDYIERAALSYNNPDMLGRYVQAAQGEIFAMAQREGWAGEVTTRKMKEAESKVHYNAFSRLADNDPGNAAGYLESVRGKMTLADQADADKLLQPIEKKQKVLNLTKSLVRATGPRVEADDVIDFVMYDLEGGATVVTDSNGALVKYGMNQAANPDLDVANLSAQDAKAEWKKRYYNAIGGDELPPEMRVAALSFAATSGVRQAKQLLAESEGDPDVFLQKQEQFYRNLAEKNPARHGKSLKGWMNRLEKVRGAIELQQGTPLSEEAINRRLVEVADDPDVVDGVMKQYRSILKAQENERKETKRVLLDDLGRKVMAANGDWTVLSPVEVKQAQEAGVWDDIVKIKGASNPAIVRRLVEMDKDTLAQVDIRDYAADLTAADYEKWTAEAEEARKPDKESVVAGKAAMEAVKQGWQAYVSTKGNAGKAQAIGEGQEIQYFTAARQAVQEFVSEHKRQPDYVETARIVQKLILTNVENDKPLFATSPQEPLAAEGEFGRQDLSEVTQLLTDYGWPVTDSALEKLADNPAEILGISEDEVDEDVVKTAVERMAGDPNIGWPRITRQSVLEYIDRARRVTNARMGGAAQ
jgi:hypothetical protein